MKIGTCEVEGCGRPKTKRSWCPRHYKRWLRHGDPTAGRISWDTPFAERFWSYVDKSGDCWIWMGYLVRGYGYTKTGDRGGYAHRFAYEMEFGPIPEGDEIDHKCRNRSCVRPSHLHAVSHRLNRENLSGATAASKSGVRGVHMDKRNGRWQVTAKSNGRRYSGGMYADLKEAEAAAIALRNKVFTNNLADRK